MTKQELKYMQDDYMRIEKMFEKYSDHPSFK